MKELREYVLDELRKIDSFDAWAMSYKTDLKKIFCIDMIPKNKSIYYTVRFSEDDEVVYIATYQGKYWVVNSPSIRSDIKVIDTINIKDIPLAKTLN